MKNKYFEKGDWRKVRLEILTEEDCEKIVNTAKEILAETGVEMTHDKARELLRENGCIVEGKRVKFPGEVIDKAISLVPRTFDMYDREGNYAFTIGGGDTIIGPANTNSHIIDSITGERRESLRVDARQGAWVCDALPNISWAAGMSAMTDMNQEIACIYESYEMINNTSKPISTWALDCERFQYMVDMYNTIRGGREKSIEKPYVIILNNPTTPLVWEYDEAERLIMMVENGVVPGFGFEQAIGSTAPATIAGTLVDILLACMVGIAIAEFTRPGAPFITGLSVDTLNMRTGGVSDAGPERPMATCAVADIARYLGIPTGTNGGCSDSPVFDQQAAFEMAMQIFTAVLAGNDVVSYTGFMEAHMGISFEALAYCDEVCSYAKWFAKGIDVNKDTLAKEVIQEVGDGSMFLTHEHTMAHCRDSWSSDVFRQEYFYTDYVKEGHKDLNGRLNDKVRAILERGNQKPLKSEMKEKLDTIMRRAEESVQ